MRELKVVGLDVDGKRIICESDDSEREVHPARRRPVARRRARRQVRLPAKPKSMSRFQACCVPKRFRPGFARAHPSSRSPQPPGVDVARVERFAHPVLLERSRAAELATAAHPVLADGPAVLTLLETVTAALVARGLDPDATNWDAWRNEDGRWTVQLAWKAGRSDNVAHFRFTPGAHGGTATAFDDAACELIDPDFARPLRPVAPVAPTRLRRARATAGRSRSRPDAAEARAQPHADAAQGQAAGAGVGGRAARRALQRPALARAPTASASSASHATGDADAGTQHEPPPHRRGAPSPHRRRQPADGHQVEPDRQQRMNADQPHAQHHDRAARSPPRRTPPPSARFPTASASSVIPASLRA